MLRGSYHRKIEFFGIVSAVSFGVEEFVGDVEADEGCVFHPTDEKESVGIANKNERFFEEAGFAVGKRGLIEARFELNLVEGIDIVHVEPDEIFQRNFL